MDKLLNYFRFIFKLNAESQTDEEVGKRFKINKRHFVVESADEAKVLLTTIYSGVVWS